MKNEILEHYKQQSEKAQKYLVRYIEELKLHFGITDSQIIKIHMIYLYLSAAMGLYSKVRE